MAPMMKKVRNIARLRRTVFAGAAARRSATQERQHHDNPRERGHHHQDGRREGQDGEQKDRLDHASGDRTAGALAEIDADVLRQRRIGERSGGGQDQKIKLYAEKPPASRRVLRTAQQGRHLVFEIFEAALLRSGCGLRRLVAGGTGGRRFRCHRRRHRFGRPAQGGFQPLRHFGEILVGARRRGGPAGGGGAGGGAGRRRPGARAAAFREPPEFVLGPGGASRIGGRLAGGRCVTHRRRLTDSAVPRGLAAPWATRAAAVASAARRGRGAAGPVQADR